MREQLTAYQSAFSAGSPEELAIDQTSETLAETEHQQSETDPATIRERKTLRRNLAFANAALSISNAEQYVDTDGRSPDDSVAP